MKNIAETITKIQQRAVPKNLSTEFQAYGVYLAESLDDKKHYSLYIKMAKDVNRGLLEEALSYAKGYYTAKNKAKVFMWKLKQLRKLKTETP